MSDSTRRYKPVPEHPDPDLHERLLAVSSTVAFPETPDIAASVREALAQESAAPHSQPSRAGTTFPWLHRPATFAAALALVLIAGIILIPATRETVAGWLGVPGIQIEFTDDDEPTPTVAATPGPNLGLLLGTPVTLEEARQLVDFDLALPEDPGLGTPDEVYVRLRPGGDQVAFLYGARPGFPAAAETGIGLLLVQFEAPDDAFWGVKQVSAGNVVRPVPVNDGEGLWIGGSHQLLVAPNPGPVTGDGPAAGDLTARPSANVLLWSVNGVTYRIESTLSQHASIALAESVTLLEGGTPAP